MVRPVSASEENMWARLPHKVRTDIRKGMSSGLTSQFAGEALLPDFYGVFAVNMRDLGTPFTAPNSPQGSPKTGQ